MKISPSKFLGLQFNTDMQINIFNMQKKIVDEKSFGEENERITKELHDLLVTEGNKNYLMSKPSIEISKKINVGEEKFDGKMFGGLPVGRKITILINENLFYRYFITPTSILCIWVTTEPIIHEGEERMYMKYTTFRINTENGYLSYPESDPFAVELFKNFIQYLIFLEFSELETVTLKPNVKVGTKKQGLYLNDSNSDVVIVDSTWNRIIVKVGEFKVSGHLRFQKIGGIGSHKRKLIYIKEYTKEGYTRNAKKETTI